MLPYPFLDEYRAVRARLSKSDSFRASARMIGQDASTWPVSHWCTRPARAIPKQLTHDKGYYHILRR